jgi:hypothetical protein
MLEKISVIIKHNKNQAVALIVVVFLAVFMGCDSQVKSMLNPGEKVSRGELEIEKGQIVADLQYQIAAINEQMAQSDATFEQKTKQLDKLDAVKQKVAEFGMVALQGGTINPVGAVVALMAIYGVGATVDNRKKDGLIKGAKANGSPANPSA